MSNNIKKELSDINEIQCFHNSQGFSFSLYYEFKKLSIDFLKEIKNNFFNEINLVNIGIQAISVDDVEFIIKLIKIGIDANSRDPFNCSFLMWACATNAFNCANLFIDLGVDVKVPNISGDTALSWARYHKADQRIVNLLIENGANEY